MFKRRTGVIAFLLVAVMLLGVGFAAVSQSLTIQATAKADVDEVQDTFQAAIGFTASEVTSTGTTVSGNAETYDYADSVSFSATGFKQVGDKAVVKFTLSNSHPDLAATISDLTVSSATTNFRATAEKSSSTLPAMSGATPGSITVTVTVEMIKTPTAAVAGDVFTVGFTASAG